MIERRSLYEEETTELPLLRIETRCEDGQPESRWLVGYAAKAAGIEVDVWVDDSPQTVKPPMDCACDEAPKPAWSRKRGK